MRHPYFKDVREAEAKKSTESSGNVESQQQPQPTLALEITPKKQNLPAKKGLPIIVGTDNHDLENKQVEVGRSPLYLFLDRFDPYCLEIPAA